MVRIEWGKRIRRRRTRLGLSQDQVAERLHLDQRVVSRAELGAYRAMNPDLCLRFAVALDCAVEDLCSWPVGIDDRARSDAA